MTTEWPWLEGVEGTEVRNIIESDAPLIKVESGPGTGKTFALVRRVERIIHHLGLGVSSSDVLVVAFNRVICKELQKAFEERFGKDSGDIPVVKTIHALSVEAVGRDKRILLPHEREAMIYDVLHQHEILRSRYKRHSYAEQALRDYEANIRLDLELWAGVRDWLNRHDACLISRMPGLHLDQLASMDLTDQMYQYVVVDEFQDLTPCEQQLVVRLRTKKDGNLIALGDAKQSIYAFRGNAPHGLDSLLELVHGEEVPVPFSMVECRRCPAEIVEMANDLMSLRGNRMLPASEQSANLHAVVWDTIDAEAKGMARAIVENINIRKGKASHQKYKPTHLAMVTRKKFGYMLRNEIAELAPDLEIGMNFSENLLNSWPVREAFIFFCLVADPDPATWRSWFSYRHQELPKTFKANKRNTDAYLRFLDSCSGTIAEDAVLELAQRKKTPSGNGGSNILERALRYATLKSDLAPEGIHIEDLLSSIFQSDIWDEVSPEEDTGAQNDMFQVFERLQGLLHDLQAESKYSDSQLLQHIARIFRYHVATREPFVIDSDFDLQISTLWGGKGVTADHVYILGLCEEAIPGKKREEYPGDNYAFIEEQRRLFYVSITRPRHTLVLSRASGISFKDAKQQGLEVTKRHRGGLYILNSSQFLRAVSQHFPEVVDGKSWEGCASS